jgi:small subunit ribosomal protein S7
MRRAPAQKRKIEAGPRVPVGPRQPGHQQGALEGQEGHARTIVYDALEMVERRANQDPVNVLKRAIDNLRPQVEVRSRRVGGSSYQVPIEVSPVGPTRWRSGGW